MVGTWGRSTTKRNWRPKRPRRRGQRSGGSSGRSRSARAPGEAMANGRRQKRRPRRHRRAPRRTGFYRTGLDPKRTASWPAPARWTVFDAFDLELLTSEEYLAKTRGVRPTRVDDLPLAPA